MRLRTKMRMAAALAFFVLIISSAFALDYRPATIKSMDVTITTEAEGSFYGTVSQGDSMELLALSLRSLPGQELVSLDEYMEIGGKKILPGHVERGGLYYADYKIGDLYEFAGTPQFRIVRQARVKKAAKIGLGQDYNLSVPIGGLDEYKAWTAYIETGDRALRSKAQIEFGSDSEIETIRQVAQWVNSNIEYDFGNYYDAVYSAKQTYDARAGVCDEFANLSAAFLRIKGIPARYVSGISFDGERFANHGWLEAYLPQSGWIGVDSTYGEAGYLDAGHFTITTTADANDSVDFIATTTSRKPVQVATKLGLPQVTVNSVEFFEGLTKATLEEKEVHSTEAFELEANVTNVSGQDMVIPIELAVHRDFEVAQPQQLVHFKKGEEKTIMWKVKAPKKEIREGYYKFGVAVLLPDGNVAGWVRMVPGTGKEDSNPHIEIGDISPDISEGSLQIQVVLQNFGAVAGAAKIAAYFEGQKVSKNEVEVQAFGKKTVTEKISGIRPGVLTLTITTDSEKTFEITIPEKMAQEKPVVTQTAPPSAPPSQAAPAADGQTPTVVGHGIWLLLGAVAIAGIVAAGIALLLLRK